MAPNWFTNLFIEEAKAALESKGNSGSGSSSSSNESWIGDGNTHIWITLTEGRTSPILGVCPKGTVTVNWGDGTTPDTLTGTSTSTVKWTPTHDYAKAGDYIITLSVDGEMGFYGESSSGKNAGLLRHSNTADNRHHAYQNAIRRIEIGSGVTSIGAHAFNSCYGLSAINIPDSVTSIGEGAFKYCYGLPTINIPDSVTKISSYAFDSCYGLTFSNIPDSVTSIGDGAFKSCYSMPSINIPESVTTIGLSTFYFCSAMRTYDFTKHTTVPTITSTNAFDGIPADCKILVPAALYDEWIIATNWSTFASKIVAA